MDLFSSNTTAVTARNPGKYLRLEVNTAWCGTATAFRNVDQPLKQGRKLGTSYRHLLQMLLVRRGF